MKVRQRVKAEYLLGFLQWITLGVLMGCLGGLLRMKETDRKVMVMCGMGAVFAGLFGTPLTACLFTMEFASVGTIFSPALLPCFLASYMASRVSGALGVHAEGFALDRALWLQRPAWRLWRRLYPFLAFACAGCSTKRSTGQRNTSQITGCASPSAASSLH